MSTNSISGGAVLLAAGLMSVTTHLAGQAKAHYTGKELKQMIGQANTPEQFQTLAAYYLDQEQSFRVKAQSEKEEYDRCVRNKIGDSKFPSRADIARNLYQYCTYKADRMADLARRYRGRLQPSSGLQVTSKAPQAEPELTQNERMLLERIRVLEREVKDLREQ